MQVGGVVGIGGDVGVSYCVVGVRFWPDRLCMRVCFLGMVVPIVICCGLCLCVSGGHLAPPTCILQCCFSLSLRFVCRCRWRCVVSAVAVFSLVLFSV